MSTTRTVLLSVLIVFILPGDAFVEELDDTFMESRSSEDIWLIKFYAPWCSFCQQLDPVWHRVGAELRSLGSPVNVGKADGTASTGLAKEFRVRGYPAIVIVSLTMTSPYINQSEALQWFRLKKDVKYHYSGPRTKDGIMDFANRVGGPLVRSLKSLQLFQNAMSHHDIMFVYVGATSPLKGNFTAAAEELIVHTYFFSTTREVLPKVVSIPSLPAVVLFKDGASFTFSEERDGDLKSWINRERFPHFSKLDSYSLYATGESGKLVALALVDNNPCEDGLRYKHLVEKVSAEHRDTYSKDFIFGYMDDSDYLNGLVMGEVAVPSFMVVDLSTDSYFLPLVSVDSERRLLDFLDGVLDGSITSLGGNSVGQRVRRVVYDISVTLTPVFSQAPLLGCFLVCFPLAVVMASCYLCCRNRGSVADDDDDDAAPPQSRQKHKKSD